MATLYITEFSNSGADVNGRKVPAAVVPPVAEQTVAIGASSAASAAFNSATSLVRLQADAVCSVTFGTAPTATAAKMRMAAGAVEYFAVAPGSGMKVANITNT